MPDYHELSHTGTGIDALTGAAGFTPWGAIAQGVGGLINTAIGFGQRHQGKKMIEALGNQPQEVIPNEVLQNQEMAKIRANTGLPSEQYNQAMKNLQRQQLMQLTRANDRRGGLSILAGNQQAYNDALLNLDVKNAQARINNEKTLYGINNQVGQWRDKIWNTNVLSPWQRKYQYAMSLAGQGGANAATGLDQLGAAGVMYGASRQRQNTY